MAEGPLTELAVAVGGVSALAAALGVHRNTVSRWNRGEIVPEGPERRALAALATRHRLNAPFPIE
ncbi:helix-turn-helix domain-containing protein [Pendulispora brunnea]|uniref:Helix-turn-helix domain-containing protein n=1 Tax=Pendulispora brunnea TaxID=2905690 RepID=A0ABZ2KDI2_9BACT